MSHMIELKKVSKFYSANGTVSTGLSKIDLNLDMGEFVVITGESGSGKSTLLNVISGLDTYEEGEMFVAGEDTSAFRTSDYENYRKNYIGNIFQDFNLINSYTVYQNIELAMVLSGEEAKDCKDKVNELIDQMGLKKYTNSKVSKLSGGQKQRVAIARALAKDAPIIVADEPTGNLDSKSADMVMRILSEISNDRLVIIVTHNYEQAEPYVTRKLTLNDGRIIEDKKISEPESTQEFEALGTDNLEEVSKRHEIKAKAATKLGVRNTFNVATKLILLLIVYAFVTAAVTGKYSSTKSQLHQNDISGYNQYFSNAAADRIVVKKADSSAFTDDDISKITNMDNVKSVVKSDITLDGTVYIGSDNGTFEGKLYEASGNISSSDIVLGRLPENKDEVVIGVNKNSTGWFVYENYGEELFNDTYQSTFEQQFDSFDFGVNLKVVGIVIDSGTSSYDKIYTNDATIKELEECIIAHSSTTEFSYNSIKESTSGTYIYTSEKVPQGQCYIKEDVESKFTNSVAAGKPLGITVSNIYFNKSISLKVGKVITSTTAKSILGIDKETFENRSEAIYVNPSDYNTLYSNGIYQISVYMQDEKNSDTTKTTLEDAGYTALVLKDTFADQTGGANKIYEIVNVVTLIILFIVLFFIAYAVIRIIMKSRNSYYSTLRILGANKKHINKILRVELLLDMVIGYIIAIVGFKIFSVVRPNSTLAGNLEFMGIGDYIFLFIAMLVMSLLISERYSRKIFKKSAMETYREEA